jgi:hypothetical protein
MADPPIEPVVTPTPADQRMEALEAMILALGDRIERMAPPIQPPPIVHNIPPIVSSRGANSTPHLPVRNRRFDVVLSIDTYRLQDRSLVLRADQVASLTSYANQIRPRLADCMFTWEPPLHVLPFLKQLTRVADQSFLSEAILLWIVEDFMRTPAKEAYRAQHLDSWPAAVHWLLSTYASETSLEAAVRKMQVAGQQSHESVRQYGSRLQLDAAALGPLMSTSEIKSLFSQGLLDPVRSLFAANQPGNELEEYTPLSVLVGRAELLETGTRLTSPFHPPTRVSARVPQHRPNVMATPAVIEYGDAFQEPPAEVLAISTGNTNVSSEKWTCFVCYRQGHGWLECPWLSRVPETDKEEALLRRRQFMERFRSGPFRGRSPSPISRHDGSRPTSPLRHQLVFAGNQYAPSAPTVLPSPSPDRRDGRPQSENGQASPLR